jgi:hypothetical protein
MSNRTPNSAGGSGGRPPGQHPSADEQQAATRREVLSS